jgi:nitrite reductase/ring-hydroxylating ferredoxin subunit
VQNTKNFACDDWVTVFIDGGSSRLGPSAMEFAPKDAHTRQENIQTQPLVRHSVFNNPDVVAEGWYPVCTASQLKAGQAKSFLITHQRIVLWRGEDRRVRAIDAFCPHMGADLGNGEVVDQDLRCYFHKWRYSGEGQLQSVPCMESPPAVKTRAWPVQEAYGTIWVYAAEVAPYPVPEVPGLEGQKVLVWRLSPVTLYAHHHVMMVGGIDLQHFGAVHNLHVDFKVEREQSNPQVADWRLRGPIGSKGWRGRLAAWLFGGEIGYHARFSGGSVVALSYGAGLKFWGKGPAVPALSIVWGCVARADGIGEVRIFLVAPRGRGVWGWIKGRARLLLTAVLLAVLKDDDVKAFPHMRFNLGRLVKADQSVAQFVRFIEKQPVSAWSKSIEPEGD